MGAKKDPQPDDPNLLVGVEAPADGDTVREMAFVFADEFARLGFDESRLLDLFRNPFYVGPHGAWRTLGDETIGAIVAERASAWSRLRVVTRDRDPDDRAPEPCAAAPAPPESPTGHPRRKED